MSGPQERCEGNWQLSLESERLLNSLDFPSQPSRERVRPGNVFSEQGLLKPLGWVNFLPGAREAVPGVKLTPPLPINSPRDG